MITDLKILLSHGPHSHCVQNENITPSQEKQLPCSFALKKRLRIVYFKQWCKIWGRLTSYLHPQMVLLNHTSAIFVTNSKKPTITMERQKIDGRFTLPVSLYCQNHKCTNKYVIMLFLFSNQSLETILPHLYWADDACTHF